MSYPVTYHCPRCGTVCEIERAGYLADKAVTPYPFEGWSYASPDGDIETADGVRFVCGEGDIFVDEGCGEPFYLSYVRFERGEEVEPPRDSEYVTIAPGTLPRGPRWPGGPN